MKNKKWIVLGILFALLIGGGYGVMAWVNRPMGQTLTLQTPTESMAPTVIHPMTTSIIAIADNTPTVAIAISASTEMIKATEKVIICGNTGSMNLMVLGLTTPTEDDPLAADAIRLVTINFDQPSATILTLPALLWVKTPALDDLDLKEDQLNFVYTKAYMASKGDPEEVRAQKASQIMAQTIVDNFGFVPDHYLTVNEGAFIKYVDALGGIEINLPRAVDGRSEGFGVYPAGSQLLDGTRALNFARLFYPGGNRMLDTWGNLERQNLVVKGILDATLNPLNWTKIPSLMKNVHQAINTDLSLNQTLDLACMVGEVGESARMLVVTEDMVTLDGLDRRIPDIEAIKSLIAEMGGND